MGRGGEKNAKEGGGSYKKHAEIFTVASTVRRWRTVPLPAHLLLNRAGQVAFQTGINIRGKKKTNKHAEKTHTHAGGTVSSCINRPDLPLFVKPPPRGAGDRRRCRAVVKKKNTTEARVSPSVVLLLCRADIDGKKREERVAPLIKIYSQGVGGGGGVHAESRVPQRRPRKVHADPRLLPETDAADGDRRLIRPPAFPLVSSRRLAALIN